MKRNIEQSSGMKIDLFFLIVLLVGVIYFVVEAMVGGFIPLKYILLVAVLMLAIFGVLFFTLRFKDKKIAYIRRGISALLAVFLIVGSVFMGNIRDRLSGFNAPPNISVMGVVVKSDAGMETIEDLNEQTIGYMLKNDKLSDYAIKELSGHGFIWSAYDTLDSMLQDLDAGMVDALLMSKQDYTMRSKEDETFLEKYQMIHQIEMKEEMQSTANMKDITNTPFTVLISGMDDLGVPDYNGLSDVNMLLLVDPIRHHIEMVSIPRDAYVPNAMAGNYPDKLTHLGWQGPDAIVNTLEGIFGIEIDYYAKVSFSSLIEIVDTLGGVDVDVKLEFTEQNEYREMGGGYFVNTIHLYPGVQTLNGSEALAYARHRHTEGWGDSGRNFAQQQIIKAIVDRTLTLEGVTKVPALLEVATKYVSTNMPSDYINKFVNSQIEKLRPWTFSSVTMLNGAGDMQVCASAEGQRLWVYLLSQEDINHVYTAYISMFEAEKLSDFKFDLNDLDQYVQTAPTTPYLVTLQNFDAVMSTYFPRYYGFVGLPDENEIDQPIDPEDPSGNVPENPDDVDLTNPDETVEDENQDQTEDGMIPEIPEENGEDYTENLGPQAPEGME